MALAPFYERVYGALGGHLAISRDSLESVLGRVTVGIQLSSQPNDNEIWIGSLATNLAARIYPKIAITGNAEACNEFKALAKNINPDIEFFDQADPTTTIGVGDVSAKGGIYPSASGWVAKIEGEPRSWSGPKNPYSSGAAACLACAELFRRVFVDSTSNNEMAVSLLNFDKVSGAESKHSKVDIGDVAFVGIGAVGNAALWALSRDGAIKGNVDFIDAEVVELSNLQRYVLAYNSDIGKPKVDLANVLLSGSKIKSKSHKLNLDEFVKPGETLETPTLVISVDNVDARRAAQALLPKMVVNGWTGEQALGASWHVFSKDVACLACLYHPHGVGLSAIEQAAKALGLSVDRAAQLWVTKQPLSSDDIKVVSHALGVTEHELAPWKRKSLGDIYTDVVCGAVPLNVKGVTRIEMVPLAHQSALAGILMAAELVKRSDAELSKHSQAEPLVSWDNILQVAPTIWAKPRAREPGCICGDPDYQHEYKSKWGKAVKASGRRG